MKLWIRRISYTVLFIFWLSVMVFPTVAFFLATQDEIQLGSNPRSHIRFFMVREDESGGVGVEWTRKGRQTENCTQTSIHYFLWKGKRPENNTHFCQCFSPGTDIPLPIEEATCATAHHEE